MRSELAKKLKTVLDNMSQEQFNKEWNEIVEQNIGIDTDFKICLPNISYRICCSEKWRLQLYLTLNNLKSKITFNNEGKYYETFIEQEI